MAQRPVRGLGSHAAPLVLKVELHMHRLHAVEHFLEHADPHLQVRVRVRVRVRRVRVSRPCRCGRG